MSFTYQFPRPSVTVDAVVFTKSDNNTKILLIQRKNDPYKGKWALPGGFLDMDETLLQSAFRELFEETGIKPDNLNFFNYYDTPTRDPRGRTITAAFYTEINFDSQKPVSGDDAANVKWFNITKLPETAFDHDIIIQDAIKKYKSL